MTKHAIDYSLLVERGWIEIPNYFDAAATGALRDRVDSLVREGYFHAASIRRDRVVNKSVRSDSICWINDWFADEATTYFRDRIISVGHELSAELRVALKSFEGHFSHYSPGNFYLKHLDQHLGNRRRQISFVSYLNDCEGGELVIYSQSDRNAIEHVIRPKAGKLALFLSGFIFHEVRESLTDRFGLTGWFRDDLGPFANRLLLEESY